MPEASSAKPVGSVKRIITENLESAPGHRVEIAELGNRYREVCKADGKAPASLDEFLAEVERFSLAP